MTLTVATAGNVGLESLRACARRGTLDPLARIVLDRTAPGWDRPVFEARWEQSIRHLVDWRAAHDGQLPRQKGPDRDAAERRAGDWLRTQKQEKHLNPQRRAALDLSVPGWSKSNLDLWRESKDAAAAWVAEHGRWPSPSAGDEVEARHAAWIRAWRKALPGRLDETRRHELDRDLPGWDIRREDLFRGIAHEYRAWMDDHDAVPAVRARADDDERRLAAWMNNARGRHLSGRLGQDATDVLTELVPHWQLTLRERRELIS